MAAVARGEQEMLAAEETVAAPTPLAFWRVRRGLTKSNRARPPASRKAISRTSKSGRAMAALLKRLVQALRLRIGDLVADSPS